MRKGSSKYDWVSVEEDMPFDDPVNKSYSIPVRVKFEKGTNYPIAFYSYISEHWHIYKTGRTINRKVIAWTNEI